MAANRKPTVPTPGGAGAKPRVRDPEATKQRVLDAAKVEFARHGLAGARVDAIADRAKANKQMIYHYFGSKQDLFLAVLEAAYSDIRNAESKLDLDHLGPIEALKTLVSLHLELLPQEPRVSHAGQQ